MAEGGLRSLLMASEHPSSSPPGPLHRRDFFRQGFRNLLQSVAKAVEDRLEGLRLPPEVLQEPEPYAAARPGPAAGDPALEGRLLRPPGALKEDLFAERCERSGECVRACPVQAIRVIGSEDARLNGTPSIDPPLQACVVCEGLHCMRACPSGALSFVPRHLIEMGLAEVRHDLCVRTVGEECQLCVEKCPLGLSAIEIAPGGRVEVKAGGCTGCGVCEMVCPTEPKAVVVRAGGSSGPR
jgi:ferredoxin-type protein NapG